jgi:hypothetical protein
MNNFALDVNLDLHPWCNEQYFYDIPRPHKDLKKTWHRSDLPISESNLQLKEWLEKRGITYYLFDIFIQPPQWIFKIHVDNINLMDNAVKLNFAYGTDNGYNRMCWYKTDSSKTHIISNAGGDARYWEEEDCTEVYSHSIQKPSLVNTGQPHSVKNLTDEPRICFSFPLVDMGKIDFNLDKDENPLSKLKDYHFLQWETAIELLKNDIK